ncbi:MAG: RdgB/HAM1 family non-canonical purine NTP pyrophosphatase [Candidatus Binatia bacterium]
MTLVAATHNAGKLREFRALLGDVAVDLRSLAEFPGAPVVSEGGTTFVANARAKAYAIARHTGYPALADDSGLEVDALGGAPGVRAARFAADGGAGTGDRANVELLLQRLQHVPEPGRTARFRCAIVIAAPDGRELVAEGACEGSITTAPRGGGGFGYDPVFLYGTRTFAELEPAEKDAVSHRARALAALRPHLLAFLRAAAGPPR